MTYKDCEFLRALTGLKERTIAKVLNAILETAIVNFVQGTDYEIPEFAVLNLKRDSNGELVLTGKLNDKFKYNVEQMEKMLEYKILPTDVPVIKESTTMVGLED